MTIFKSKSLNQYLNKVLIFIGALILILVFYVLQLLSWQTWNIAIAMAFFSLLIWQFCYQFRKRILSAFQRALLHLESIKVEDYNQYARSDFDEGCTADLHTELKQLSLHFQSQKSRYDQHAFLLYQLIDQLNTPIMVFNQKLKLTYANAAFANLYGQPWQMYRMSSPHGLGLTQTEGGWRLERKDQQWQISQSEFIDTGETHLLLVFTNIDSAIRASQQSAWQQIIRVMGHEIRNSLTPVSSLAESLSSTTQSDRERQALEVISERCHHLQEFINRYASLSQKLELNIQAIEPQSLIQRIQPLFLEQNINFIIKAKTIDADAVFLEQVIINLIKNALEAGATQIDINVSELMPLSLATTEIVVKDNGQGIANLDNLFVPLFTTKPDGQGIGLTFCRNIIEQHKGTIEVLNNASLNSDDSGVSVVIKLPHQSC